MIGTSLPGVCRPFLDRMARTHHWMGLTRMGQAAVEATEPIGLLLRPYDRQTLTTLAFLAHDHDSPLPGWRPKTGECQSRLGYMYAPMRRLVERRGGDRRAVRNSRQLLLLLGIIRPGSSRLAMRLAHMHTKPREVTSVAPLFEFNLERLPADLSWIPDAAKQINACLLRGADRTGIAAAVEQTVPVQVFGSEQWRQLIVDYATDPTGNAPFPGSDFVLSFRWTGSQLGELRTAVTTGGPVPQFAEATPPMLLPQPTTPRTIPDRPATAVLPTTAPAPVWRHHTMTATPFDDEPLDVAADDPWLTMAPAPAPAAAQTDLAENADEPAEVAVARVDADLARRRDASQHDASAVAQDALLDGFDPPTAQPKPQPKSKREPRYPKEVSTIGGDFVKAASEGRVPGLHLAGRYTGVMRTNLYDAINAVWQVGEYRDPDLILAALTAIGQIAPSYKTLEIELRRRRGRGFGSRTDVRAIVSQGAETPATPDEEAVLAQIRVWAAEEKAAEDAAARRAAAERDVLSALPADPRRQAGRG